MQLSAFPTQAWARALSAMGALLALCVASGCTRLDAATTFNLVPDPADPTRITAVVEGGAARSLKSRLNGALSGPPLDEVLYFSLRDAQPPIPVLARLEWSGDTARLRPAVPLTRGKTYVAVLNAAELNGGSSPPLREEYTVPEDHSPSTSRVAAIYPNHDVLPANLLKFYVHFSEPMAEGRLFKHARLLDAQGKAVAQAFREVELWDDDHRRVTLWINPGRTKQALGLSESLGAVLEPDKSYTLEIGKGLADQYGRPLPTSFAHRFHTAGMDHEQPDVKSWQLSPPAGGTREPLRVTFPAPLDHSLALDSIGVEAPDGSLIPGLTELDITSTAWTFTPNGPWKPGDYRLAAKGEVEDLAGNSLYRSFETPAGDTARPATHPPIFRRQFAVK